VVETRDAAGGKEIAVVEGEALDASRSAPALHAILVAALADRSNHHYDSPGPRRVRSRNQGIEDVAAGSAMIRRRCVDPIGPAPQLIDRPNRVDQMMAA
jgi:hypothetical protein